MPFDVDVTRLYEFAKSVLDERNDVQSFSSRRGVFKQDRYLNREFRGIHFPELPAYHEIEKKCYLCISRFVIRQWVIYR